MFEEVKTVKIWRMSVLFYLGGMIYSAVELLWRRWTHGAMFMLGGLCFVTLGRMGRFCHCVPAALRAVMASTVITVLELLCGLAVNREYGIWDYRGMPLNFRGQVCLPFFAAWMPLGLAAMWLYGKLENALLRYTRNK